MKILISGHKGFLGSVLVNHLYLSHDIIGISKTKGKPNNRVKEFKSAEIIQIKDKPDVVIMCHAAVSSGSTTIETKSLFDSNVAFTTELINQFSDAYFLFISSISVYGNQSICLTEASPVSPMTEYGISKLWGEQIVKKTERSGILRLSSLYGENMKENTIIPIYVNQALKNKVIEVWGNADRKQNYFHVLDALAYIEKIITKQKEGVFLGTFSKEYSNIELAKIIGNETGASIKLVDSDIIYSLAFDNTKTRQVLEIKREKDFVLGIKEYINWKQKQF